MSSFASFEISAAGMAAQRLRLEVAAMNLANANTVNSSQHTYQPRRVLIHSVERSFEQQLSSQAPSSVLPQARIELSQALPLKKYDPSHPMADTQGFISVPPVDPLQEMLVVMQALRAYEANVVVANATRSMLLKTLDIGS